MWETIALFFLKGLLPIVGYFIDKSKADAKIKSDFMEFVRAMNLKEGTSIKLHKSYEDQFDKLKNL